MEVQNLQLVSAGGISETTFPGTYVVGNHYVGTIQVSCVPYSNGGSGASIAMYGEFTITGFNNTIVIPLAGSTITNCWSDTKVNFDAFCTSTPQIAYVLNANGGAGEFIVNITVYKTI
jgi:hypothetical protein